MGSFLRGVHHGTRLSSRRIRSVRPTARCRDTQTTIRGEAIGMATKKKGGKRKKKAETVFLVCEETGDQNYALRKKSGGEKLKLMKYSPRLRRHTLHLEKKK